MSIETETLNYLRQARADMEEAFTSFRAGKPLTETQRHVAAATRGLQEADWNLSRLIVLGKGEVQSKVPRYTIDATGPDGALGHEGAAPYAVFDSEAQDWLVTGLATREEAAEFIARLEEGKPHA